MASATSKMSALSLIVPVFAPVAVGSMGYAAWRVKWGPLLKQFLTGPGRTSRLLLLFFMVLNWKNMPFAWTYRVFYTIFYHSFLRKSPKLGPKALFKPIISRAHAPLLEIDYNLHKSNSTYFADLDVSRTHLVSYLCRESLAKLAKNTKTKVVLDPKTDQPIKGPVGIMLGAVECSFKKEIAAYQGFEMWSRMLCWDRKWMYIVTHFMPKNAARPAEWLDPRFAKSRKRGSNDPAGGWERKIYATAVSKYVFKLGRFTVHPAIVLGNSGLLPERPGGWMGGEQQLGDVAVDVSDINLAVEGEWDWRRVEAQRRKGMELAGQFHALEELQDVFDGGNNGALGKFGP
ncbi:Fc.00g101720.m01.CDS01 [Cosmosporella sp. VM-42]